MLLYFSPTSPYVRKVSVTASELGIALDREAVAVHAFPSDYGKINPVNRIPALRLDDGSMMFDSRVICEYLDTLKGSRLLPPSGPARWQVLKRQVLGDGILDAAVPRIGEVGRPAAQQSPGRLAEYERSIRQTLDALEAGVGELRGLDLGTIAVGCGLGYLDFRFPQDQWRNGRPNLAAWYGEFAKRPAMVSTMPKAAG
jgi:glutathione S-transferase